MLLTKQQTEKENAKIIRHIYIAHNIIFFGIMRGDIFEIRVRVAIVATNAMYYHRHVGYALELGKFFYLVIYSDLNNKCKRVWVK
jgi:hypothetical protein